MNRAAELLKTATVAFVAAAVVIWVALNLLALAWAK